MWKWVHRQKIQTDGLFSLISELGPSDLNFMSGPMFLGSSLVGSKVQPNPARPMYISFHISFSEEMRQKYCPKHAIYNCELLWEICICSVDVLKHGFEPPSQKPLPNGHIIMLWKQLSL